MSFRNKKMGNQEQILCIFSILHCVALVTGGAGNEWDYKSTKEWKKNYPFCGGLAQSPVNIDTTQVQVATNLGEFFLGGYATITNVKMNLVNNGHTVKVDLKTDNVFIQGGGLQGKYLADQFHFHWGSENQRGSEHAINGEHYPMEMHIVHHSDKHKNLSLAQHRDEGLAVLGFMFEIGRHNFHFDEILVHFDSIAHKNDHADILSFPLLSLLPSSLDVYYRYHGSLTTPPCYESVIWTIFKKPIEISQQQLNLFRKNVHKNLINETDTQLSDDFRPLQNLNSRQIYGSHPSVVYEPNSSSSLHVMSVFNLSSSIWILLMYIAYMTL